jgi:NitT/TauT family transport system substrate-binding protein
VTHAPKILSRNLILVSVSTLLLSLAPLNSGVAAGTATETACSQPTTAPKDLGTLVVAGRVENAAAIVWGSEQGCFKKYGLDIKNSIVASTPLAVAGLVSNSFDLIASTPSILIQAMTNGDFPVRIIAPRFGYTASEISRAKQDPLYPGELLMEVGLIVRNDSKIKTFKDLQNRKVGLSTLQSSSHAGVLLGVKAQRGDPSSVQIVVVPSAQASAALKRKDVDAIAVAEPFASQAITDGGRLIGYPGAYYYKPSPAIVYASSEDIVQKKRQALKAFQKAVLEINRLLNQPQYDSGYRKIYASVAGIDAEAVAKVHLPELMETNVSLAQLHFIPFVLYQLGFTRTKIDISSIVFK